LAPRLRTEVAALPHKLAFNADAAAIAIALALAALIRLNIIHHIGW
jgi:hypothetical protein